MPAVGVALIGLLAFQSYQLPFQQQRPHMNLGSANATSELRALRGELYALSVNVEHLNVRKCRLEQSLDIIKAQLAKRVAALSGNEKAAATKLHGERECPVCALAAQSPR